MRLLRRNTRHSLWFILDHRWRRRANRGRGYLALALTLTLTLTMALGLALGFRTRWGQRRPLLAIRLHLTIRT